VESIFSKTNSSDDMKNYHIFFI